MNRILILIFALFHLTANAQDQDDLRKLSASVSILTGMNHVRMINEGLSFNRLLLTGTGLPLSASYRLGSSRHRSELTFDFLSASLGHREADIPVTLLHGSLSLAHLRNIATGKLGSKQFQLFAGMSIGTNIKFFQAPSLDNDDILVINAIHLLAQGDLKLNERSGLNFSLAIPTVALAKRLVLDGGLHEPGSNESKTLQVLYRDSKLIFANTYGLGAGYVRKLSAGISWVSAYNFNYVKNNDVKSIKLYSNEIKTGFRFNLKK